MISILQTHPPKKHKSVTRSWLHHMVTIKHRLLGTELYLDGLRKQDVQRRLRGDGGAVYARGLGGKSRF